MKRNKLFMLLLGCKPENRHTEQHDIFFGIGENIAALQPAIRAFWPEPSRLHVDAWREVAAVGEHRITIIEKKPGQSSGEKQLFFINLGGYKENEFDEFHYKILIVAGNSGEAVSASKKTAFYRHTGFEGAISHIDDKYGVDVDDIVNIEDILSAQYKDLYRLDIESAPGLPEDPMHLGYLKWEKMQTAI